MDAPGDGLLFRVSVGVGVGVGVGVVLVLGFIGFKPSLTDRS